MLDASVSDVRRTRLVFWGMCCYLASQAFQIPLKAVGPSWAVWPTLSDLAIVWMFLAFMLERRHNQIYSWTNQKLFKALLYILICNMGLLFAIYFVSKVSGLGGGERADRAGIFQLFRLAQFVLVFRIASGIPLTPQRIKVMSRVVDAVIVAVFLGLVGTFTSAIPTRLLVSHLPSDFDTAGPWGYLSFTQVPDAGTIGYNHAYTSVQLIMLMALGINLAGRANPLKESFYLLLGVAGVFLSGSRAGMAAAVLIVVMFSFRRPQTTLVSAVMIILVLLTGAGLISTLAPDVHEAADRHLSLRDPLQAGNLSGRQYIWQESLEFIQQEPVRWIIGAGPGSAALQTTNAHMLYLHIIMETGLIGLAVFCFVVYKAVTYLKRYEHGAKPVLLATLALLFASLTQETFYPVPAFGHFLGFYLCSLAFAVRVDRGKKPLYQIITVPRRHPNAGIDRYPVLQR